MKAWLYIGTENYSKTKETQKLILIDLEYLKERRENANNNNNM